MEQASLEVLWPSVEYISCSGVPEPQLWLELRLVAFFLYCFHRKWVGPWPEDSMTVGGPKEHIKKRILDSDSKTKGDSRNPAL